MTRPRNIQHGRKRRMPASVVVPCVILAVFTGLLAWEIMFFFGGA
ncbi:hypothetical protein [Microbacterium sp. CH12i]|nr:hypothetical protein [Microbacterium sp. CH12i]